MLKSVLLTSQETETEVDQVAKYQVPADVPDELIETFIQNMDAATAGTGKMNLFCLLYTSPSPRDQA